MPKLTWDTLGSRFFETGVDRGVLYVEDQVGVPWNGLISITESPEGGSSKSYYLDGERYLNRPTTTDFAGTIRAFSSPEEFDTVDGSLEIYDGFVATGQKRKAFGLSYRTILGNDILGQDFAYKIHILYNVLAEPSDSDSQTIGSSVTPTSLSWTISATPIPVGPTHKPTAHFIVDSSRVSPETLADLEALLYGSDEISPSLPALEDILDLFASYAIFKVTLLPDNHYSAEGSAVTDLGDGTFEMSDSTITDHGDNSFSIL
jgi:hypothetical protein